MDEGIEDVMDVFNSLKDHEFSAIRNDLNGLVARLRAMEDAVEDLRQIEENIQDEDWAVIPEGDEQRRKLGELLIDVHKVVDDGYLSSVWALRESMDYLKQEYASDSEEVLALYNEYRDNSRIVIGLRTYSHHGNALPISIRDQAVGDYIGDGEGVRRKIGIPKEEVWEKRVMITTTAEITTMGTIKRGSFTFL